MVKIKEKLINYYKYIKLLNINFKNMKEFFDSGLDKISEDPLQWWFNKMRILISLESREFFYYESDQLF